MKIYFDTCSLNRPLDDKSNVRVSLEGEAILRALALCESGVETLVSSEVLEIETRRNPNSRCKAFVTALLGHASDVIMLNYEIEDRARILEGRGFKAFDSLHVACAEAADVDYFCTCDDRLLKKARRQTDIQVKVVSPLELAEVISE